MQVRIRLTRQQEVIYEGIHSAGDAEEFGVAFKAVWDALHARQMQETTSVGELMSRIREDVLDDINGTSITIERLDC